MKNNRLYTLVRAWFNAPLRESINGFGDERIACGGVLIPKTHVRDFGKDFVVFKPGCRARKEKGFYHFSFRKFDICLSEDFLRKVDSVRLTCQTLARSDRHLVSVEFHIAEAATSTCDFLLRKLQDEKKVVGVCASHGAEIIGRSPQPVKIRCYRVLAKRELLEALIGDLFLYQLVPRGSGPNIIQRPVFREELATYSSI